MDMKVNDAADKSSVQGAFSPSVQTIRTLFPVAKLETLEPGVLAVGYSGERPTDWLENGRLIGIHGEVRQQVAEVLGLEVKPVHMLWEKMIPALKDGTIDVPGMGTAWTQERERIFGYTQPYQYFYFGILQPHHSAIVDFEDLRGKRIAVIGESFNNSEITRAFGDANVGVYPHAEAIVVDMLLGRIDVAVYDFPNILMALANHPSQTEFHVLPFKFDPQHPLTTAHFPNYLVFRRESGNLRAAADLAVDLLKASGILRQIYVSHGFSSEELSPTIATNIAGIRR